MQIIQRADGGRGSTTAVAQFIGGIYGVEQVLAHIMLLPTINRTQRGISYPSAIPHHLHPKHHRRLLAGFGEWIPTLIN